MRFRISVFALLTLFCLAGLSAAAANKSPLGDQISGRVELTPEERVALEPVLAHYYALDGTAETMQSVLEIFANTGCRGDCMADLVGMLNTVMKNGQPCSLAGREVVQTLMAVKTRCMDRGIPATPAELSRTTRSILESKYLGKKDSLLAPPCGPTTKTP